jgi:predicted nicotinamide N-methyase
MLASALYSLTSQCTIVDGIECRQVTIDVQLVGPVTILEATAKAQDDLVDMALALNEDELTAVKQLLQSGDPYGAVLWPAASAISNHLMTQCSTGGDPPLEGLSILELGTGTGLVSLAASLGGATKILATDYESVPLRLLQEAQAKLNKGLTTIETGKSAK